MEKKMELYRLGTMEYRFLSLIWDNEPINSMKLVQLCNEVFDWKKSTTYTMLKQLQKKGLVANQNAIVTSLVPKEQVQANESEVFMNETFSGSLPSFLTAFLGGKTISEEEAEELKQLIDSYRG